MPNARTRIVDAARTFGGDELRDVWAFDEDRHESLYLRDDVETVVSSLDVDQFVDVERYGFITRDTYEDLYYTEYRYTVRGFDEHEQFRTFLQTESDRFGLFASFDRRDGGYDWGTLYDRIETAASADDRDALLRTVPE